jgi:hypothetical protein
MKDVFGVWMGRGGRESEADEWGVIRRSMLLFWFDCFKDGCGYLLRRSRNWFEWRNPELFPDNFLSSTICKVSNRILLNSPLSIKILFCIIR